MGFSDDKIKLDRGVFNYFNNYVKKVTNGKSIYEIKTIDDLESLNFFKDGYLKKLSLEEQNKVMDLFNICVTQENMKPFIEFAEHNAPESYNRFPAGYSNKYSEIFNIEQTKNTSSYGFLKNTIFYSKLSALADKIRNYGSLNSLLSQKGRGISGTNFMSLFSGFYYDKEYLEKHEDDIIHFNKVQKRLFSNLKKHKLDEELFEDLEKSGVKKDEILNILKEDIDFYSYNIEDYENIDLPFFKRYVEADEKIRSIVASSFVRKNLGISEFSLKDMSQLDTKQIYLIRRLVCQNGASFEETKSNLEAYAGIVNNVAQNIAETYKDALKENVTVDTIKSELVDKLARDGVFSKENLENFVNYACLSSLDNELDNLVDKSKYSYFMFNNQKFTKAYIKYDNKIYELDAIPLTTSNQPAYDFDTIKQALFQKYKINFVKLKPEDITYDFSPITESFLTEYSRLYDKNKEEKFYDPDEIFDTSEYYLDALSQSREVAAEYLKLKYLEKMAEQEQISDQKNNEEQSDKEQDSEKQSSNEQTTEKEIDDEQAPVEESQTENSQQEEDKKEKEPELSYEELYKQYEIKCQNFKYDFENLIKRVLSSNDSKLINSKLSAFNDSVFRSMTSEAEKGNSLEGEFLPRKRYIKLLNASLFVSGYLTTCLANDIDISNFKMINIEDESAVNDIRRRTYNLKLFHNEQITEEEKQKKINELYNNQGEFDESLIDLNSNESDVVQNEQNTQELNNNDQINQVNPEEIKPVEEVKFEEVKPVEESKKDETKQVEQIKPANSFNFTSRTKNFDKAIEKLGDSTDYDDIKKVQKKIQKSIKEVEINADKNDAKVKAFIKEAKSRNKLLTARLKTATKKVKPVNYEKLSENLVFYNLYYAKNCSLEELDKKYHTLENNYQRYAKKIDRVNDVEGDNYLRNYETQLRGLRKYIDKLCLEKLDEREM